LKNPKDKTEMAKISKLSVVEKGARLADDVVVGPFCYVGGKVEIASGCVLENNVTIVGRTAIGEDTRIFPMSMIGMTEDGDEDGVCVIGKANAVREHVTILAGTTERPTELGTGNLIMVGCNISGSVRVGNHVILANCTNLGSRSVVEDYVRMSAFSYLCEDIIVGSYAFVAGLIIIDRNIPDYSMVQGVPPRVRGVNTHNLKACGFGEGDIRELKRVFRDLFNGGDHLNEKVLAELDAQENLNVYVRKVVDTIKQQRQAGLKGAW